MQYKGKLFGKVGREYFPLILNSDEVDAMQNKLAVADEIIKNISTEPTTSGSLFKPLCGYEKWNELTKKYFEE